uniref:PDZ domain-containing protein n=1 Tax=Monopterus albus TaxID=43700 RepID=A0A3Q3IZ48_MONAL|nr:Na(+)/H(+) exchange regulatory cofactor NHE-RF3 [Monopterus albus]
MATYKPRVISLTKRPGQTFGFFLRTEQTEEGHLIRSLEMGGQAELAGFKDGDRILRINGTFVDGLSHLEVVELVQNSGTSVTFHILDEASYKQAKEQGVNLCGPQSAPLVNGAATQDLKPKLCYLLKSKKGYGFAFCSVKGKQGLFMTEVIPGSVADRAGVKAKDRLVEVNGENVEDSTHDQVADKIKLAGDSLMLLLVDAETDRYYQNRHMKIRAWLATTKHLPHKPRIIEMTKRSDGYGFVLKQEPRQTGHFINDIDRGSPADRAGLKKMDRLVAVDGKEVDNWSHKQVVGRIKQSGNECCLLVVDKDTDQMYKQGNVSPMLFWGEIKEFNSPPSYIEAINLPVNLCGPQSAPLVNGAATIDKPPSTPAQEREEALKPKLCKMKKTTAGYGFHLSGIQGVQGQYISEVVTGGAADKAGLEDDDIVVEVNGVNVEQSSHEEVVAMIHRGGSSLEMLVAKKNVYDQLKAKEEANTRLLLGEASYVDVHTADSPDTRRENRHKVEARPQTPPRPARRRTSSVSSSSSNDSFDIRF